MEKITFNTARARHEFFDNLLNDYRLCKYNTVEDRINNLSKTEQRNMLKYYHTLGDNINPTMFSFALDVVF